MRHHLISERRDKPSLFLRVATLDDDPGQTPQHHIWASQQPKWLTDAPGAPHYDEWEPGH